MIEHDQKIWGYIIEVVMTLYKIGMMAGWEWEWGGVLKKEVFTQPSYNL